MNRQSLIAQLAEAFCCLPGVGPKTAQRMVLYLLDRDREGGVHLANKLVEAMEKVRHCKRCRNLTESEICEICASTSRDPAQLCVVESPADVFAIEQTGHYRGHYFVTMGNLSPIDGIGPEDLGVDQLLARAGEDVGEVILALASTVEGEATTHFISEALKQKGIRVSRIAQGVPLGGELEYIDGGTLSHAFNGRREL
ncbi:MAG TPA: recombination mediator RecR [Pseudomonadales bacterium]|nr:recombination mediator RecR [Pseudomonadales bacterium]